MGDFLDLFNNDKPQTENNTDATTSNQGNDSTSGSLMNTTSSGTESTQTSGTLELHKEELDINKNKVDAGEVILSKNVVEEQKTVDVPVMHEEVVIKRTPVSNERTDASISSEETLHIPVSQEQVDVNKYTVTTEEISASKRQVEETQQIQETLKREEANVNTTGSVDIVTDGSAFDGIK
jgi:uncharacterized protein (TIGR02271 family)